MIQEHTLQTPSGPLHYLEAGDNGPVVVLLHGKAFQAETWRETGTLEYLAGQGFHCLALDMPGFGKSPAGSADFLEVLQLFFAGTGVSEPVLLGPSMGGGIALEYALTAAGTLRGLILVGAVRVVENASRLASLSLPTLVIWGSEDTISPPSSADLLEREVRGAVKVILQGAPHPCYLDQPQRFNETVGTFLQGLLG
ncbi:MAG: 2-hydroxy-6-oxo-6-phenylhexa-2,4-dienoate hydrolase [Desulfobulbus propionicus]|nr:MAG: 2-hydroxy-6-oxo-6-phenylhexa-2,4-dienoate hydrolase [Desulfobulbus propionicus]